MKEKNYLFEAAGVPDYIFDSSVDLYEEIFKHIKEDTEIEDEKHFTIDIDIKIGDLSFNRVNLQVTFVEYDEDKYQWIKMGISNKAELTKDFFFKQNVVEGEIDLVIDIAVPENWQYDEFLKYYLDERNKMIESISHELMHVYDNNKKGYQDPRSLAEYVASGKVRTGITPLDRFSHYLYYVTMIENIVRPTEVHSYLKLNKATQKKFLEYLKDNDTYKKLVDIKNFSYEGLRKNLLEMIPEIENFFDQAGVDPQDYQDLNDDEKVDLLLQIYHKSLTHAKANILREMLSTSFLEIVQGFTGEKDKFFIRFLRRISRFESFRDFFKYEESNFNDVATKMIKKISKVYSLLADKEYNKIQESIINWDLYHRINKTQEKLLQELKIRTSNRVIR